MRTELKLATLALAVVIPGLAFAHHHAPRFKFVPIGTFGGTSSIANSINRDGVVVGFAQDANGVRQPYRFHHGRMTQLAPLAGSNGGAAYWVNDEGDVCGASLTSGGNEATLWIDGNAIDLGASPTGFPIGRCLGLADHEDLAVGFALSPDRQFSRLLAFEHGDVIDISLEGYGFHVPFSTNRHGVVAGFATAANPGAVVQQSVGFTYDLRHNRRTTFTVLPGDTQTLVSVVTDHGKIYGFSYNDTVQRVVEFDPRGNGQGEVLRSEPAGLGLVVANERLIVETYSGTQDPVILVDGEWLDLMDLIDGMPDDGFVIADATDMNERGDITAYRENADGSVLQGFVLEVEDD